VQHDLTGVSRWRMSELRDGIGVMEIGVKLTSNGTLAYTINTVCNEVIDVLCTDVRETIIKHRADGR
jgi:hypothetical protein